MHFATEIKKLSNEIGCPSAVRATLGSNTGQRTVDVFAITSAQGAETPQLS